MIALTTPNGNIGKNVVSELLAAKLAVRVISYQPDRLPPTVRESGEVIPGSLDDANILRRGFAGADAAFWCVPQSHRWEKASEYYGGFTTAVCDALSASPAPRLVGVSGGGYGVDDNGILSALATMENRINATGVPTRLLRSGYFMENLFWSVETIKATGTIMLPIPADVALPLVAARDIAGVATRWLVDTGWRDQQSPAVYGPSNMTMSEMAQTISESLQKPVQYVEVSGEAMKTTLLGYGAGVGFADAYVRMCEAFAGGSYDREPRTAEATTPTTLREWAETSLLPIFRSKG